MVEVEIRDLVTRVQKRDEQARQELFQRYLPRIRAIAAGICGRPLDWSNDDELSVSLIAFNEAIDTYDENKGMSFLNYARMLIHRRLVDHFRRESRFRHASLDAPDEETEFSRYEVAQAWNRYQAEEEARDQGEMVARYNEALRDYGISLDDLLVVSPKHRDTKQTLMRVARELVTQPALMRRLREHKQLPVKELMVLTGVSHKVLETGRKYIIALALVLSDEEFLPIRQFIRFPQKEGW